MKRIAVGLLILALPLWAKKKPKLDFGGKVYLKQEDDNFYPGVSVYADYKIQNYLTWRNGLDVLIREAGDSAKFDLTLASNLLHYPFGHKAPVDPYWGPGLSFTHRYTGDNDLGANIVLGVDFRFVKGKTFGLEARYTMYDLPQSFKGEWQLSLTGSWEFEF